MSSFAAQTGIPYDKKRQGFLVDLDTLYDTRLAVIEEVDFELALHQLRIGWSERLYDRVEQIPPDKYKELYDNRDLKTLVLANPTMATEVIRGWCVQVSSAMTGTPERGFCEVFLNVWPYRLGKTAAREFAAKIDDILDHTVRVTIVNVDPKEITAYDAKLYFSCIMMQDWYVWLEERAQRGELKKAPIPDVSLYAPRVFRGSVETADYEQIRDKDVFATIEEKLKPIIGLEFLDLGFFSSAITPELASALKEKVTPTTAA